jgi:hypothetical protein
MDGTTAWPLPAASGGFCPWRYPSGNSTAATTAGMRSEVSRRRQQLVLVPSPDLRELMGGERENGEGVLMSLY